MTQIIFNKTINVAFVLSVDSVQSGCPLSDQSWVTGCSQHGVQCRMISVDNFFIFLRLLFFALFLLYVT